MKKVNIYTHFDNTKTVIAQIIPREDHTISKRTFNKLLKKRTIGGITGVYSDAPYPIRVVDDYGRQLYVII